MKSKNHFEMITCCFCEFPALNSDFLISSGDFPNNLSGENGVGGFRSVRKLDQIFHKKGCLHARHAYYWNTTGRYVFIMRPNN